MNFSISSTSCVNQSMSPGESCTVEVVSNPTTPGLHQVSILRRCEDANLKNQIIESQATVTGIAVKQNLNFREKFLSQGRTGHTSTLLSDGKVLVVGGYGNGGYLWFWELLN